jgi:uncharacterized protein (DUF4415 family)
VKRGKKRVYFSAKERQVLKPLVKDILGLFSYEEIISKCFDDLYKVINEVNQSHESWDRIKLKPYYNRAHQVILGINETSEAYHELRKEFMPKPKKKYKSKGRPRHGKRAKKVYSIRIDPHDHEKLKRIGDGNVSKGINLVLDKIRFND